MLLVQGIMSAISAGMLIYAATVEMLAGDFVFGDVEGGHHHHHHAHDDDGEHEEELFGYGHGHGHGNGNGHAHAHTLTHDSQPDRGWKDRNRQNGGSEGQASSCPQPIPYVQNGHEIDAANGHARPGEDGEHHAHSKKSSMGRRALAVVSLLLGVTMMVLVGLGE